MTSNTAAVPEYGAMMPRNSMVGMPVRALRYRLCALPIGVSILPTFAPMVISDLLQQSRTDDAEHADTLESAHHNHQADELADGAGVNVAFVIGVRRHNETRNQGEYCGDDENRLIFGYIDQPASHPFLRE